MPNIAIVLVLSTVALAQVRYDGFEVHRVVPRTSEQLEALKQLEEQETEYNFWTGVVAPGVPVDIMVPPHLRSKFKDMSELLQLEDQLWIENVQDRIDAELPQNEPRTFDWTRYQKLDSIHGWLRQVSLINRRVTTIVSGTSYEGRNIVGVRISYGPNKPAVFLEGGIHANEWISPATVTYIINEILNSKDPAVRKMAERYEWYIFPSINPDGYVYTHEHDRLWRKTRSPQGNCIGTDPNRNWDFHWGEDGANRSACSVHYSGPKPFSEVEIASLSQYIAKIKNLAAYIAFHSYSQVFLLPYGYSHNHTLVNYNELKCIGEKAAISLAKRHGTVYKVGNTADMLYIAPGISMDWVKGTLGTRIAFTYELRDTGHYGFLLPPDQIIPTAEETVDSLVTLLEEANSGNC